MKKKVLFVIDSLCSGGAEKSLVSLLSVFDYEKYEVDLLTFKSGGLYEELLNSKVNRIKTPVIFSIMSKSINELIMNNNYKDLIWRIKTSINIRYTRRFTKVKHGAQVMWPNIEKRLELLKKEYDVAIAYSQGTPTYYVAEKVNAKKKICWINTDYNKAGYNKNFDKEYYKKYRYIVTVSNKNKEILDEIYGEFKDRIKVIYDIISANLIKQMALEGESYKDNFDGIRILTIGRHVQLKGYDIAIDAAKLLKKNNIKFRWYSIGEGVLTEELKAKVLENNLKEEFIFLGTYANPYPFIKDCDIYCQTSRFEGFGMAIAEAKILNKVIISTDFDIIYDQIQNNKNGIIVKMNAVDLSNQIKSIMENQSLRNNLINNLEKETNRSENEIQKVYLLVG